MELTPCLMHIILIIQLYNYHLDLDLQVYKLTDNDNELRCYKNTK